jgi:hypothetical protein
MAIEDNFYSNGCSDDDVISLYGKFYKVEALKAELNKFLQGEDKYSAPYGLSQTLNNFEIRIDQSKALALLTDGTDSEILKVASSGWKKGRFKLKMAIEFIPDEPQIQDELNSSEYKSPLDEIRNHPSFPNS